MSKHNTVMVQVAGTKWTENALDEACQIAQQNAGELVLVLMIPSTHAAWLGTELPYVHLSRQQRKTFAVIEDTLKDYEVPCRVIPCQYVSLVDALAQAAEELAADTVFAHIPDSHLPFWKSFQEWHLLHKMTQAKRRLILNLDDMPFEQEAELAQNF